MIRFYAFMCLVDLLNFPRLESFFESVGNTFWILLLISIIVKWD